MRAGFPRMVEVRQHFPTSAHWDFAGSLQEQFATSGVLHQIAPGSNVAIGVGSRGITNLAQIVKTVVALVRGQGAKPFIVPAMGSHGGATPEGQEAVLAGFGITRESMGVPFETSMAVRSIGRTADGREVVFSEAALRADSVLVINRVKPHTDFQGGIGSGLQKMLTIGFGKHVGAINAHQAASHIGHESVIRQAAEVILGTVPVLCGVSILEDQHHQTAAIEVVRGADLAAREPQLLQRARSLMPQLPFREIDLLIIDEIGKEISGTGMDTNVIHRGVLGYIASLTSGSTDQPHIRRIFVRGLTEATHGNGIGIGLADFTTTRAVRSLNLPYMYTNALTSLGLPTAKIPIYFDTDREVIERAVDSLAAPSVAELRVVRIVNTLKLDRMLVSDALAEEAKGREDLTIVGSACETVFDETGNLLPFAAEETSA